MKAEEFYNKLMKEGKTYHICSNEYPEYSNAFYQSIFAVMNEFAESQLEKESIAFADYCVYNKVGRNFIRGHYEKFKTKGDEKLKQKQAIIDLYNLDKNQDEII